MSNKTNHPLKVSSPAKFDEAVDAYVKHQEAAKEPLLIMGALLWMGIYDRHTLDKYAARDGFGPSVKRLIAMVAAGYEKRLHGTACVGAIFALKNMGWTDKQDHSFSGPDGAPLSIKVEVIFVKPDPDRKS